MSDQIKIQNTAPDELSGGGVRLSNDDEVYSRNATTVSTVFRSFPPAPDVEPGSAGLIAPAGNNRPVENVDSFYVAAPVAVNVKPVDSKTVQGSYAGDHRSKPGDVAASSLRTASGSDKGPRDGMGQFPLGGRVPAPSAPQSFPGDLADSDQGN